MLDRTDRQTDRGLAQPKGIPSETDGQAYHHYPRLYRQNSPIELFIYIKVTFN